MEKGTWMYPISVPFCVVIWSTSEHKHKRQDHKAAHDKKFDRRDVEFNLAR